MVYHVTRRPSWEKAWSGRKFFLTVGVLGAGLAWACTGSIVAAAMALVFTVAKLQVESRLVALSTRGEEAPTDPLHRSAWLIRHPLCHVQQARLALGVAGGVFAPLLAFALPSVALGIVGCALLFAGEILARQLFFQSMTAVRMPGMASP